MAKHPDLDKSLNFLLISGGSAQPSCGVKTPESDDLLGFAGLELSCEAAA
jgi:hypothetical protein